MEWLGLQQVSRNEEQSHYMQVRVYFFRLISWKGYQSTSRLEEKPIFLIGKICCDRHIFNHYPLLTSTKCSCPLFGQDIGISCADTFNQQQNQLQLELCRKQNLQTRFLSPEKSRYRMSSQS